MMPICKYATFRPHQLPSANIPVGARSVGHHTVPANWRDSVFTLNHICCIWTVRGGGEMVVDDRVRKCPAHHFAIYFPGMVQEIYTTTSDWEYCWWTMDGPQAVGVASAFGLVANVYRAGPAPTALISRLQSLIIQGNRAAEIDASTTAIALLAEAAKAIQLDRHHAVDSLVEAARERIQENWQYHDFGVESLAVILQVDRSTLSRRFRSATGVTVIQYLVSMRIQNAISLLTKSHHSIAEIADHCGFCDPGYFCRVFSTRMGIIPSEFRKRKAS